MSRQLPEPLAIYSNTLVTFHVWRAKDQDSINWNNSRLREIVRQCRTSYYHWGKRKLFDKFDFKAAIYLVRALYQHDGKAVHEWLSVRFVPGGGNPLGNGEVELYHFQKQRLDIIICERYFNGSQDFWKYIVSGSRLCGIRPEYVKPDGPETFPTLPRKLSFSGYCFALAHHIFLSEPGAKQYRFITGIMHQRLSLTALQISETCPPLTPPLIEAHQTLGVKPESIYLDRKHYAYAFPTYWLDHGQLADFLDKLRSVNLLTEKTYFHYLGTGDLLADLFKKRSAVLSRLGSLTNAHGKLIASSLTGPVLRRLLDTFVSDGPHLLMVPSETWREWLLNFFRATDIKSLK